jgi:hypothetical protein
MTLGNRGHGTQAKRLKDSETQPMTHKEAKGLRNTTHGTPKHSPQDSENKKEHGIHKRTMNTKK